VTNGANPPSPAVRGSAAAARAALMRRALLVSDIASTAAAMWIVFSLYQDGINLTQIIALPCAVAFFAKLYGLYDNDEVRIRHATLDEVWQIAACIASLAVIGALIEQLALPGGQRLTFLAAIAVAIVLGRGITRRLVVAATPPERCVLVGSEADFEILSRRFERSHHYKAVIVDRLELNEELLRDTDEAREMLRDLVAAHRAERVIVVSKNISNAGVERALITAGLNVSIAPSFIEIVGNSFVVDDLSGMKLLGVRKPALSRSSLAIKRTFDLALTIPGLILISPLLILITVAIRISSSGPALYRQRRIGRHGYEFTIYKFRSMVEDAHSSRSLLKKLNEADDGLFKIAEDPRVTGVGKLIRKTGLDELPQLFNVLGGSMSLVGPRPLIPEEDARLKGWERFRQNVPPGMTGPWQIGGSSKIPINEMAALDYRYATDWSLWVDIKLLLRTVIFVLGRHSL